jgi:amidophosphoribosyltransferase
MQTTATSIREIKEECGIAGVILPDGEVLESGVVPVIFELIFALQHRGEESAGIVTANRKRLSVPYKTMGKVRDLYVKYEEADKTVKRYLEGYMAAAHARYSTTGSSTLENAGPFLYGDAAVAHNGNITNASFLKEKLVAQGAKFNATTDSEVIAALIQFAPGKHMDDKILAALSQLRGSFSLVIITSEALYGVRDGMGNRPLSLAKLDVLPDQAAYAFASETAAFFASEFTFLREIQPGEILKLSKNAHGKILQKSFSFLDAKEKKLPMSFCALEIAYLMRPDSRLQGVQMDTLRRALGKRLAEVAPAPAGVDFVSYIPESARPGAEGFGAGASLPIYTTMIKGRYGAEVATPAYRGFMQPNKSSRSNVAKRYFPFDILKDKDIVLVDDSVVRGTTTKGVIKTLRAEGARKIHLRIIFPEVIGPCYLGTDIGEKDHLVAKNKTQAQIAHELGVDSVGYLTIDQYQAVVDDMLPAGLQLCFACANNRQPKLAFIDPVQQRARQKKNAPLFQ